MRTASTIELDVVCPYAGHALIGFGSKGSRAIEVDHSDAALCCLCGLADEERVVVGIVQDRKPRSCRQRFDCFSFRRCDRLTRTEKLDVALARVGDERDLGLYEIAQLSQLPRSAHSHLNDHEIGFRICVQKRFGHAKLIILVAFGRHHLEGGREDIAQEILRGGLAGRASERDNGALDETAPTARKISDSREGRTHLKDRSAHLVCEDAGALRHSLHTKDDVRALPQCLVDEIVSIDALSRKRYIDEILLHIARIPRDPERQLRGIERLNDHGSASEFCNLFRIEPHRY